MISKRYQTRNYRWTAAKGAISKKKKKFHSVIKCYSLVVIISNSNVMLDELSCLQFEQAIEAVLYFPFIFQLRECPCNITHDILFLIYNGYF